MNQLENNVKFLFLDIDGVLNSAEFLQSFKIDSRVERTERMLKRFGVIPNNKFANDIEYYGIDIDPEAFQRLQIVWKCHPETKIVISSSWRHQIEMAGMIELFKYFGWNDAPIIGYTPELRRQDVDPEGKIQVVRGHEVEYWLAWAGRSLIKDKRTNQPNANKYVILDDDSDFLEGQPLVQTSWETGLLNNHIDQICRILSNDS
jgi:hypothetical protein